MNGRTAGGWLRTSLLTLLGIFAALTLVIGYTLLNPNTLKPLANYLSDWLTGRTLTIDGDLAIDLSWQPRAVARNVKFSNADWSAEPYMAVAEHVDVQIDLAALFERRVHLVNLELRGMTLRLDDRVDGRPNWDMFEDDESSDDWSFMIEGSSLEYSELLAEVGELEAIDLQIPEFRETSDPDGNLNLEGHGTINGDPWQISGRIGTLEELLIAGRIELDLALTIDDVELEAAGSIGELASLTDLDLIVSGRGPDADTFGEIFAMPEAFDGPVALTARVLPDGSSHVFEINGNVAAFEVSGEGTVQNLNALDGWDARLDVKGPNAGVFGKALQITGFPQGPFEISGGVHLFGGDLDLTDIRVATDDAELLVSADFVEFPKREGAIGTIHLQGPDIAQFRTLLRLPTLPAVPFDLTIGLKGTEGELAANLTVGAHALNLDGYLGEFPDYHGTRLTTHLAGDDIAKVLLLAGVEDALHGDYELTTLLTIDASGYAAEDIRFSNRPFELAGRAELPQLTRIEHASFDGQLAIDSLAEITQLAGLAAVPNEPVKVEGRIRTLADGSPQRLVLDDGRIHYRTITASVAGSLAKLTELEGMEARIILEGPSFDELFSDAVPEGQTALPFTITSTIRGRKEAVELIDFDLKSDGGDISANGLISLREASVGTRLSVRGSGQNLADTVPIFPNYIPPKEPWELEAEITLPDQENLELERSYLHVGSVVLSIQGTLDLAGRRSTDILFEARGDSIQELGQIGEVELPDIPFSITTKLDGTPDGVNVTRFHAEWGESDLDATGSVDLHDKPDIVLRGRSQKMILVDLQKAIFGEPEDEEPADDATSFFPDVPIPIEDFQAFNADIDIDVGQFRGRQLKVDDLDLELSVLDGVLKLERASYRDDTGYFDARAVLKPEGDLVAMDLQLLGEEANLGVFVSPDQSPESIPRYTMDIDIEGTGRTVAELAGSIDGRVLISSDGGRIDNAVLEVFAGDFITNVLETLNPFSDTEAFTPMECLVVNGTMEDGRLQLEPGVVMRTNRVNMFVFGNVDLKTERLNLSLATQARRGLGISAASITNPYFKIGGTLASPQLQLDPASAALAASIATATAGLSIVIKGLWDRLMGERNPCPEFLKHNQPEG